MATSTRRPSQSPTPPASLNVASSSLTAARPWCPGALPAKGDVYVITGPVFEPGAPTVGACHVRVPRYLFKLVYDATTKKAWAHWQENREGERVSAPISYAELVRRTGIDFLPSAAR